MLNPFSTGQLWVRDCDIFDPALPTTILVEFLKKLRKDFLIFTNKGIISEWRQQYYDHHLPTVSVLIIRLHYGSDSSVIGLEYINEDGNVKVCPAWYVEKCFRLVRKQLSQ